MKLRAEPTSQEVLVERGEWHYEPPYDFYDDDGKPVLNPERFLAVRDETGALVGWFYFEERGDDVIFGLGLRPDFTGRGLGLTFVRLGVDLAHERFGPRRLILDVAEFNERAAKVYERAGFRVTGRHVRKGITFLDMELAQ